MVKSGYECELLVWAPAPKSSQSPLADRTLTGLLFSKRECFQKVLVIILQIKYNSHAERIFQRWSCLLLDDFSSCISCEQSRNSSDEVLAFFPLLSACFYLTFISSSMHLNLTLQIFLEDSISFPDCDRALCLVPT